MSNIVIKSDDLELIIVQALMTKCKEKLEGYSSPLNETIVSIFNEQEPVIKAVIHDAVVGTVASDSFKKSLQDQLNKKLANLMINKCSGLVEKSFNSLMQDQVLRTKLQNEVISIIEQK